MAGSLSYDLRKRVLLAVLEGLSHRQAGAWFAVSASSISRWQALRRKRGCPAQGDGL